MALCGGADWDANSPVVQLLLNFQVGSHARNADCNQTRADACQKGYSSQLKDHNVGAKIGDSRPGVSRRELRPRTQVGYVCINLGAAPRRMCILDGQNLCL